ncbi:MAG: PG0541 family transporter-associated protein [Bacteroidales bacterium]
MKSVFITYNQAHTEKVDYVLDHLGIRGYTEWKQVFGRGSKDGVPHMGTHTWPEQNNAILTVVEDEKVDDLLEAIKKIDDINEEVGIRAFVWNVEKMV